MATDTVSVFIILGLTLVIGYFGSLFYEKTKIPDILWLIIFGLLIGPVFGFVERDALLGIAPLLGSFALLLILFEAGLNINFFQVVQGFSRSILLAFLSVIFTMAVVTAISMALFNFKLIEGLLLGAILGGTSSPVVLSIVNRISVREKVKTILNLESILTDPLVIIISIAILQFIAQIQINSPIQGILAAFSIGAVIGGVAGLAWLFVLDKIRGKSYDYMITLAVLFLIFGAVEYYGGSGAIATLVFGMILGNSLTFSKMLKFQKQFKVDRLLKVFQSELSFFIKSFFFVFLGIIFLAEPLFILYGLAISLGVILIRLIVTKISTIGMDLTKMELNFINIMIPRGLAAAVLAQFPAQLIYRDFFTPNVIEIFSSVVLVVIMVTILYSIFMTRIFSARADKLNQDFEKTKEKKTLRKSAKTISKINNSK